MAGRLIAVVGPSGVGKDSVMAGLKAARPNLVLARRMITRAPELGGEDFDPVSEDAFAVARDRGEFVLHWGAHGLYYGIPGEIAALLMQGQDVLANLSRGVLGQARARFPTMVVLNLTASPAILAARLSGRGRESQTDVAARLARIVDTGPDVLTLSNDGPLSDTVAAALCLLYPESR
jgi:ribose 1,5-bisphosphokinase